MIFDYSKEIKAQEDWYNGIKFRSKLESKTAQALDNLGIAYQYEPNGYKLSNGMWYRPDFWLPDAKQFIECKGVMKETDTAKIIGLVSDTSHSVIVLSYENAMLCVAGQDAPENVATFYGDDYIFIGQCESCKKRYFYTEYCSYRCPCCGYYDGDHTLWPVVQITSGTDLFNYGQTTAADKPLYKEIADNFNK